MPTAPTNAIQQLGNVPVQTPFTSSGSSGQPSNNARGSTSRISSSSGAGITLGWMQWFQAVYNAIKYLAGIVPTNTTAVPAHPGVVVGWASFVNPADGKTYFVPLSQ
jgi:hypothetical protein